MYDVQMVQSLETVDPTAWDALTGADNPFIEHAFLHGLEVSGSVGTLQSGWLPRHILVRDGSRLVGAMPLYEKYDSYGEFIFDWSWAQAAQRAGVAYYPKVVSAVPFTPATGPRLLLAADADPAVENMLLQGAHAVAQACNASSLHVLFCEPHEVPAMAAQNLMPRHSYQFHWQRQAHWHTFSDYLAALRAPSRKQVRRERATAASHGLTICMQRGQDMGQTQWDALYAFYRSTVHEKGAMAYLTRSFFTYLQRTLPHRVVAAIASRGTEPVAGALYLTKGQRLFGRYWGAHENLDALHFELCYYAPIEWGLAHGITRFEAGAQGEHKLKRGLMPNTCHSAHWLRHPGLAAAVAEFLPREAAAVGHEIAELTAHSPYRREEKAAAHDAD